MKLSYLLLTGALVLAITLGAVLVINQLLTPTIENATSGGPPPYVPGQSFDPSNEVLASPSR